MDKITRVEFLPIESPTSSKEEGKERRGRGEEEGGGGRREGKEEGEDRVSHLVEALDLGLGRLLALHVALHVLDELGE